jgi:hypothetical protein
VAGGAKVRKKAKQGIYCKKRWFYNPMKFPFRCTIKYLFSAPRFSTESTSGAGGVPGVPAPCRESSAGAGYAGHWLQEASVKRLFVGSVYEFDAPRTTQQAVSLGGDEGTLATISGSIAEAFYE